jgi:hypothetical protein
MPPPPGLRTVAELKARSMSLYGKPAEETEAEYLSILAKTENKEPDIGEGAVGRRKIL